MIITRTTARNNFYDATSMTDLGAKAVEVLGAAGQGAFVVLCEHASAFIPPELGDLGLDAAARRSHIAWDPGALAVAQQLGVFLDAPLVAGATSRLVYDCNRPFEAADCIPQQSEIYPVPGNVGLDDAARRARFTQIHDRFHAAASDVIDTQQGRVATPVLVTVHSFTPVYFGKPRAVDIGYLYHGDGRLAQAMLAQDQAQGRYYAELNAPYSASDGVTYSLAKHGESRGLQSVMIEIRNDLIKTAAEAETMAAHLAGVLRAAVQQSPRKAAS